MERLRRFIWYLAGRLFLLLTLLSLFTVTFYYAMNATNIYIVLKDGMAKRAQVIMMEEDASELTKFFQSSYLQRDQNLQIARDMSWPVMPVLILTAALFGLNMWWKRRRRLRPIFRVLISAAISLAVCNGFCIAFA